MTTVSGFRFKSTDKGSFNSENKLSVSLLEYTMYRGRCNLILSAILPAIRLCLLL